MKFSYPLDDVIIERSDVRKEVAVPLYSNETWQVNSREFAMQVEGVGSFYACEGRRVEFYAEPEADPDWVNLYLKGQMLVVLLHQRGIINFHASSFIHKGRGIMILGESGAGKSSLTASFTLREAGFISDDITPVVFTGTEPCLWSVHEVIRIRKNTAIQLNIDKNKLTEAEPGTEKQYLQVDNAGVKVVKLNTILRIEIGEVSKPEFHEPLPAEKFSLLRSEICMGEILGGMPETETEYLLRLLKIVEQVHFVRVVRPADIAIAGLHEAVLDYLGGVEGKK
jgi:hypothetical protein